MTLSAFDTVINQNGVYVFPAPNACQKGVILVRGGFGGGTVALGFDDGSDNFVALFDDAGDAVSTAVARSWELTMPISGRLAVTVTGVSGTTGTIKVSFKPIPF